MLNEAFADGRLTAAEHRDRVHAVYVARTWPELAQLTADLPGPAGRRGRPPNGWTERLDPCLLCVLLCLCPPAGIAVLLRRHWRGPRSGAPGGRGPHAEDR